MDNKYAFPLIMFWVLQTYLQGEASDLMFWSAELLSFGYVAWILMLTVVDVADWFKKRKEKSPR